MDKPFTRLSQEVKIHSPLCSCYSSERDSTVGDTTNDDDTDLNDAVNSVKASENVIYHDKPSHAIHQGNERKTTPTPEIEGKLHYT